MHKHVPRRRRAPLLIANLQVKQFKDPSAPFRRGKVKGKQSHHVTQTHGTTAYRCFPRLWRGSPINYCRTREALNWSEGRTGREGLKKKSRKAATSQQVQPELFERPPWCVCVTGGGMDCPDRLSSILQHQQVLQRGGGLG